MKKTPLLIFALALALAMTLCLAACGGGSNESSAPADDAAATDTAAPDTTATDTAASDATATDAAAPAATGEMATYDYDGKGLIFFDYPAGVFAEDTSAILGTLAAADGSVTIKFNADPAADAALSERYAYLEGFSGDEGYVMEDITVAGLPAKMVHHVDSDWGDLTKNVVIDLAGTSAGDRYSDMSIIVTGTSWEAIDSADVQAIIDSMHFTS